MQRSAHNGFVDVDIAVPDFEIKTAFRIGANPCFVVNIRSLAAEVGQGYQISDLAFLTLGETSVFHGVHLPTYILIN
jgi:hypothetical protein